MTLPTLRLVGLDVGGTKTHIAVEDADGQREEVIVLSAQWRTGSLFSDPDNLKRLAHTIQGLGVVDARTNIAAGLNGVDTPEQARRAERELSTALGTALITVTNDAELLSHAGGAEPSLQLIVGTGTVLLGRDRAGTPLRALGYGWRLNDFGSAPALVREALRELHRHADHTGPGSDPLAELLQAAYDVTGLTELTLAMSDRASLTEWGRHAPLIFQAADLGSPAAMRVIADAAEYIAGAVHALRQRGALGDSIVAAGGVITNQPRLQHALREAIAEGEDSLRLVVLPHPPAIAARTLAGLRRRDLTEFHPAWSPPDHHLGVHAWIG